MSMPPRSLVRSAKSEQLSTLPDPLGVEPDIFSCDCGHKWDVPDWLWMHDGFPQLRPVVAFTPPVAPLTAMQTLQKAFSIGDRVMASVSEGTRVYGVVTGHGMHTVTVRLNGRQSDTPFYPNELKFWVAKVECGGDGCAAEESSGEGCKKAVVEPDEDGGIWGPFEVDDLVFFTSVGAKGCMARVITADSRYVAVELLADGRTEKGHTFKRGHRVVGKTELLRKVCVGDMVEYNLAVSGTARKPVEEIRKTHLVFGCLYVPFCEIISVSPAPSKKIEEPGDR